MSSLYLQIAQYHVLVRYEGRDEYVAVSHENGDIWTASSLVTAQRKVIEYELKSDVVDVKLVRQVETTVVEAESTITRFSPNKASVCN